jgi:hypothetical protein
MRLSRTYALLGKRNDYGRKVGISESSTIEIADNPVFEELSPVNNQLRASLTADETTCPY